VGEDQDNQVIAIKEVEHPLEPIRPVVPNRPLQLIYLEVSVLPDYQINPQPFPYTPEVESRPLRLILPPGGVYQREGEAGNIYLTNQTIP